MSADVVSILALAAIFAVAIGMSLNMGLLAFAAAFLVGTLAADMTADDIFGVFPGDIFVVLVGITYLFAIAQRNGTVDWLVNLAMRAVGGRVGAIPWIMFNEIKWPVVLLICGVLTYVGVLEEMGTIDWVGENVASIGVPLLAALLLCYVGAIVSAFASSVGVLGAFIPLAVPFLLQGEVGAIGTVAALAVAATVVDVSPYSTNGALVLANAKEVDQDAFYRQLLIYGAIVVAVAPLLVWLALVVI
jgi:di/tricarboxylate transporter